MPRSVTYCILSVAEIPANGENIWRAIVETGG